ncbi:MAG TPA: protoheme IX farnesyltransferase [Bacteroidales bacterium]|nr:protoheme IX farnesyltransferase [Bacteroidales bacterium]
MKVLLNLTRINMSAAIAFSALAGYIFNTGTFSWTSVAVFCGVLMLAGAATALNQYQERNLDALMQRTMHRPLPAGQLSPITALIYALIMGICGTAVLYFFTNPLTAILGLLNIIWYNAIYTPLKTKTPFVVIIGAVTGAIPPIMGWTAAGGLITDQRIIFVASFLFLWQIPHFLLLLLKYKEDYRRAGFQSATSKMNDEQVKFIVFMWTLGTSLITLFFPLFGIISGKFLTITTIALNVLLIVFFFRSTFSKNIIFNTGKAFGSLYLYQIAILAILIFQALKN